MVDPYLQKYDKYIRYLKDFHRNNKHHMDFNDEQLEVLNHPYEVTQFINLSFDDIYDECVRDYGDINVGHGFGRIDVNSENNSMFYCVNSRWKTRSQEMTLLENFDSIATRQRELVAHIARKFL